MRNPGAIFRKLKEAKFRHLIVLYKKYLKRTPDNCKYNCVYRINQDENLKIKLCLLHQNHLDLNKGVYPHLLDLCQASTDCQDCNGFIFRYSREEIKNLFEAELALKSIKEKKYPDICALEWVLEKPVGELPPLSWISKLYFFLKNIIVILKT